MLKKSVVDKHGRAWCDVGVGLNEVKVVHELCCVELPGEATLSAVKAQELNEKLKLQKEQKLIEFRKTVKERVNSKEKLIEKEIAAAEAQKHQLEQLVVERALKTKAAKSVEAGLDVEDVQVIASGRQSRFRLSDISSQPPSLQVARQYLLSHSSGGRKKTRPRSTQEVPVCRTKVTEVIYHDVQQMNPHCCLKRLSSGSTGSSENSSITSSASSSFSSSSTSSVTSSSVTSPSLRVAKNLKPAKRFEDMDQKQAGKQFLLFRRLYSELEREKVRRVRQQSMQRKKMERIKKKRELERRLAEEEIEGKEVDSGRGSPLTPDNSEDCQMAEEWQERVLSESRRMELEKARETQRYMAALRAQLQEKMERKKVTVSPLCLCADTVWDTDPDKCANNCTFHKNSQEYIRALTNLLQSLDLV